LYRVEGPEQVKANTVASFTLLAEDEDGNLKDVNPSQLDGWLRGPGEIRGRIAKIRDGEFAVDFIPQNAGVYDLDITTNGKPIFRKGDITTTVTEHAPRVTDKIAFELEGYGLYGGRVGEAVDITLKVTDENKAPRDDLDLDSLEVEAHGPHSSRAQISHKGRGEYVATFSVGHEGEYTVEVKYDGKLVMEQPGVKFSGETSPGRSEVLNVPSTKVRCGQRIHFKIISRTHSGAQVGTGGDQWQATSSGPERVNHLVLTDNNDGSYTGEFIIPKPGTYSFDIRLNGSAAKNSPFSVSAD